MEILVPLIIAFVLWVIGKLTGEDDGNQPSRPPGRQAPADIDERTRRIQEEIRRRIAERSGEEGQPQPIAPPPAQEEEEYESPFIQEYEEPTPPPVEQPIRGSQMDDFRRRIEEQKAKARYAAEQAQEATEKAERIFSQQARRKAQSEQPVWGAPTAEVSQIRREVYDTLLDPLAARKAFLYYEILGTPVGLRRDGQQRPHWEI